MPSVNRVTLIGHCGKDPEVRYMPNGDAVANVSLATTDKWNDKNGDKQERTEWHRLSFFTKLAQIVEKYVKKGDAIYVEGKLQTRKWADKDGQDRYTTEIVCDRMQMLGGRSEPREAQEPPKQTAQQALDDPFYDVPF